MIVQVFFDGGSDPTPHDFDVLPVVGDLLKWENATFRVVERGFLDAKGKMVAAVWSENINPDEIVQEVPEHLRSFMQIT